MASEWRSDLIFFERTRRREELELPRPRFPKACDSSVKDELQASRLLSESESESFGSHTMMGKELRSSSKFKAKRLYESFAPSELASFPHLSRFSFRCSCSKAFVAGKELATTSALQIFSPIAVAVILEKRPVRIVRKSEQGTFQKENVCRRTIRKCPMIRAKEEFHGMVSHSLSVLYCTPTTLLQKSNK